MIFAIGCFPTTLKLSTSDTFFYLACNVSTFTASSLLKVLCIQPFLSPVSCSLIKAVRDALPGLLEDFI